MQSSSLSHDGSPDELKRRARAQARRVRDAVVPGDAAQALAARLLEMLRGRVAGCVLAGYAPIGSEIDVTPAMHALLREGATLALPCTTAPGQALSFHQWNGAEDGLVAGRFGTRHPAGAPVRPSIVLVPLLGFDARCARLGYGGGYYDRTLPGLAPVLSIGCAYGAQLMDAVPEGPHDVRLDAVATEAAVYGRQGETMNALPALPA